MSDKQLHRNAERVREALDQFGLGERVRVLDDTARTVQDAAAALGVKEGQIAKTLVFKAGDDRPVIVVASGDENVDTDKLSQLVDAPISKADADFVRAATGYPIGGVSPAGHGPELEIFVEKSLARWDVVWAAAGTHHAVFDTTYDQLLSITSGTPSDTGKTKR